MGFLNLNISASRQSIKNLDSDFWAISVGYMHATFQASSFSGVQGEWGDRWTRNVKHSSRSLCKISKPPSIRSGGIKKPSDYAFFLFSWAFRLNCNLIVAVLFIVSKLGQKKGWLLFYVFANILLLIFYCMSIYLMIFRVTDILPMMVHLIVNLPTDISLNVCSANQPLTKRAFNANLR